MKNLLLLLVACGLVLAMGGTANAANIASYDASVGSPVVAGDVEDPLDQGWSMNDGSLGATDVQEGVIDGGVPAWRNFDGTDNNNPGYVVALTAEDYQGMFDNGWTLTTTVRLVEGGQFLYWGGDNTNTVGGFNFPGDRRVGISLGASGNDYTAAVQATGFVGTGVATVTNGIPDGTYITATFTGIAGTATFDVEIKETVSGTVLLSETGLGFANGNTSTDAHTGFMSGSSAKDNREALYQEFTLASPKPAAWGSDPFIGETGVEIDLSARDAAGELSWTAPDAYTGATYDVYFGTTEPNFNDPAPYGLTQIGTAGQSATSAAPTLSLANLTSYYWVVDSYEPNLVGSQIPTLYPGAAWNFETITADAEIQQQSGGQTVEAGGTAQLSIGGINISDYDWYKDDSVTPLVDGGNIAGADSNTLTISNVQLADEGVYYCVADNGVEETPDDLFDTSLPVVVMTERLVGHWDFEGSSLTDSIDGRVGTFTDPNAANPAPDPALRFVTGHLDTGAGFEFKGDDLFIEVPDNNEVLNFYPQGLTVACWMTADANSTGSYSAMVGKHTYSAPRAGWMATQDSAGTGAGRTRWNVDGAGAMNGPGAVEANVQDGDWHYVVMSFAPGYDPENPDRVGYAVYVDGGGVVYVEDVPVALAAAGYNTNQVTPAELRYDVPLRIGADDENGAGNLSGVVDEVKIWSYALTPTEVAEAYAAYTGSSVCLEPVVNDFNNDCVVDLGDLQIFAAAWLKSAIVTP